MALNYSHRPIYSAHISEDDLVSPMRIVNGYLVEGVSEKNGEGYSWPRHGKQGEIEEQELYCGRNRFDRCSSPEFTSKDIVDLLPSDPFGMDIKTTFTAITGWLEDLEAGCGGYMGNVGGSSQVDYGIFAGWNLIWNNALTLHSFSNDFQTSEKAYKGQSSLQFSDRLCTGIGSYTSSSLPSEKLSVYCGPDKCCKDLDSGDALVPNDFVCQLECNRGDIVGLHNGNPSSSIEMLSGERVEGATNHGVPHEALAFALSYLSLKDLLSSERACKSLFSTVRGDTLLWMSIHIDQPLSERVTDAILLQLTNRAKGNLQSLTLVECPRITDDGLGVILENNPRLNKLCIPGCTRLSIEGIVNNLKMYNFNKDVKGVKHLRIGGIYGATQHHFEELKFLLDVGSHNLESYQKQQFYHRGNFYLPYEDVRPLDIEICPRCEKIRLVYDCPSDSCRVGDDSVQVCRACTLCIARCAQCGRCINDTEYEETFCLELLCSDCFASCLDHNVGLSTTLHKPSLNG